MLTIELVTKIRASPDHCFDLFRDLDLHVKSMSGTAERAVAGRLHGPIELGERVTWSARHFGVAHEHEAEITAFDRPRHFRDEIVRGRFRRFVHDHYFEAHESGTRMLDVIEFESPFGLLGNVVDALILKRYLTRLIQHRNAFVKGVAESTPEGEGTG